MRNTVLPSSQRFLNVTPIIKRKSQTSLLSRLYREYSTEVKKLIHKILNGGPPDPEDLMQEAFASMAKMENIETLDDPKAYLFRIAINLSHRGISHQVKTRDYLCQVLDNFDEATDDLSPERILVSQQYVEKISKGLKNLSEKQRTIVLMSRIYGMTYEEIRKQTGWSLADISRQLKQALEVLLLESDMNSSGVEQQ